jgi:NAD-specific glutamate dehydrogenase
VGLTAPENAVVLAYAKMSVFDELLASNLPDDPFFSRALKAYFPKVLTERFGAAIARTHSSAKSSPPSSPTRWSTAPAPPL